MHSSISRGCLLKTNLLFLGLGWLLVSIALGLLLLNTYGLSQTLAPTGITIEDLRFKEHDVTIDKREFYKAIERKKTESAEQYAARLTMVISQGLAHIDWIEHEPTRFNQLIPVWENYLLYAAGKWSGIPEFERYHFVTPEKAIERGIGICGDASILLSELLNRQSIDNKIITVPGHVMVEANYGSTKQLLDADFGVFFNHPAEFYQSRPKKLEEEFHQMGFVNNGENVVVNGIAVNVTYWDGASHFITKKYYFEKISYWLIWLLPLILLVIGGVIIKKGIRKADQIRS